jgi:serine phosphatase RsbU (regulator of sigma subunit)
MVSRTIVLSRNSHCPILIVTDEETRVLDEPSRPVGVHRGTKPIVVELPLQSPTTVVLFTDGLLDAGQRYGGALDIPVAIQSLCDDRGCAAQSIADQLLAQALQLDRGRAGDDITILVLTVQARRREEEPALFANTDVRRMSLMFPLPPVVSRLP